MTTLPQSRIRNPTYPFGAFTLVELLVVIAIVGVLSSLLLPAISKARSKGQSAVCINNLRQLSLATQLYVDEHAGLFPFNYGVADTYRTIREGTFQNWVNNVMDWELNPANTNESWAVAGGIGPYLSHSAAIFKCPSDRALSDLQRQAGWQERVRSYSMNAMVGNAGEFTEEGVNVNNPHYRQFFKETEVPVPANFFVLIEEHPDSINDGYFLNKFYSDEWFDLPASYHSGSANLTFADGHVETKHWVSSDTVLPDQPFAAPLPMPIAPDSMADFHWLMSRSSLK